MSTDISEINELTYKIIGVCCKVHSDLGPGLLESSYKACLAFGLEKSGMKVEKEKALPLIYNSVRLDVGYRVDLLVENCVVLEVKAVEALTDVHMAQVLTYLKLSHCKVGLLANFNVKRMTQGIRRLIV